MNRRKHMKINSVQLIYFSPTGGTKRMAAKLAGFIAGRLSVPIENTRLNLIEDREKDYYFGPDELVILTVPTYADRVPNKIEPDLRRILHFDKSPAVALVSYGNRSYGTAPFELADILKSDGARVIAGGAFVCRHVFSEFLSKSRPDRYDRAEMDALAEQVVSIVEKAETSDELPEPEMGNIGDYYKPLKEDGTPARFLKAKPKTHLDHCYFCRLCVRSCPMGAIDDDCVTVSGVCIKCHACVRSCPEKAKYFDDPDFLSHVRMLESICVERAENKVWI